MHPPLATPESMKTISFRSKKAPPPGEEAERVAGDASDGGLVQAADDERTTEEAAFLVRALRSQLARQNGATPMVPSDGHDRHDRQRAESVTTSKSCVNWSPYANGVLAERFTRSDGGWSLAGVTLRGKPCDPGTGKVGLLLD